jgi:hypothetical protein
MAGVIMLSPKNSEAPKMPSPASTAFGPHHEQDVRDGDDDRHRPEDQRDDPEDGVVRHFDRVRIARIENRLHGIQRARPDVPEHNAQSADRESTLRGSASAHGHGHGTRLPAISSHAPP